ncbi:MAG: NAD-dependent epimerase/dehydratase family protein [Actinomycetota bacterium]|nr:NAD-dependent epimerase/dehydratase family protein [Actinomycetota bacterium]
MATSKQRALVTGGAGFLGSHYVRHILSSDEADVINVDALTYAGDLRRVKDLEGGGRHQFVEADITDAGEMKSLVAGYEPDGIVHFAAESHVTRSETDPDRFFHTNVEGTRSMLEAALAGGVRRFVHISTDEVYGSASTGSFREEDKLPGVGRATSPYAQSKALADDLARSYGERMEVIVVRPTNSFGPWQFPEKVFPRWVTRVLRGEPMIVWGDGLYVRQWLYAEDLARAVALVVEKGIPGEVYNVGPTHVPEITNVDLARWLARYLELDPEAIQFTGYDRPDHDRRYAVDAGKVRALGWEPGDVWTQLSRTVEWYRSHRTWWESLIEEAESIYADSARR